MLSMDQTDFEFGGASQVQTSVRSVHTNKDKTSISANINLLATTKLAPANRSRGRGADGDETDDNNDESMSSTMEQSEGFFDWLKDYDPLFDLFDDEMRAGQVAASTDYFNSEYDLNNYYNPYKQTDELSLYLGLEWSPCLELNSPNTTTASSSPCSSSAPSPASSSAPSQPSQQHLHQQQQQQQRMLRLQLQNHTSSALNTATNTFTNNVSSNSSATTKLVDSTSSSSSSVSSNGSSSSVNISSNVNTPTSALKKRKKSMKTKGTSLLAQPSPKLNATNYTQSSLTSSSSNNLTKQSQVATPLATLLTINKTLTPYSPTSFSSVALQQVLPKISSTCIASAVAAAAPATTTTTSPIKTMNQKFSPIQKQQHHHHHQALTFKSSRVHLTKLDKNMRYCVKIEHAYSLSS